MTRPKKNKPPKPASQPEKERPVIELPNADIHAHALIVVRVAKNIPGIYRMRSRLVRVVKKDATLSVEVLTGAQLMREVQWRAQFVDASGEPVWQLSPHLGTYIITQQLGSFPELEHTAAYPLFTALETWLKGSGYSETSRVFVHAPGKWLPVPQTPSKEQVEEAVRYLSEELLGDFPFTGPADRAHALALPIALIARLMIPGQVPLFVVTAPAPGSGKTLLLSALTSLVTGEEPWLMTVPSSEQEFRKQITALLLKGRSVIAIDNVNHTLNSSALASLITTGRVQDRQLGASKTLELEHNAVLVANGNAVRTSDEIARRSVPIVLDPNMERPQERTGFRHPNLLQWVKEHRPELVRAVAILVRHWLALGKPTPTKVRVKALGSFEGFYDVVGGILEAAGVPGFLENLDVLQAEGNEEGREWREFVGSWHAHFPDEDVDTARLWEMAVRHDLLAHLFEGHRLHGQKTKLGKALDRWKGRVVSGYKIEDAGRNRTTKGRLWRLKPVEKRKPEEAAPPAGEKRQRKKKKRPAKRQGRP